MQKQHSGLVDSEMTTFSILFGPWSWFIEATVQGSHSENDTFGANLRVPMQASGFDLEVWLLFALPLFPDLSEQAVAGVRGMTGCFFILGYRYTFPKGHIVCQQFFHDLCHLVRCLMGWMEAVLRWKRFGHRRTWPLCRFHDSHGLSLCTE